MQKIIFALFVGLFSYTAQAKTISFDEAFSHGLKNSSFAHSVNANRLSEYGTILDSTNLENPSVEYGYNTDNQTNEVEISQGFRASDISLKQSNYKELVGNLEDLNQRLDAIKIGHIIESAYYDLYIAQQEAKFSNERLAFLNKAQSIIKNSVNQNNMLSSEVLAFEADILATKAQSKTLNSSLENEKFAFLEKMNMQAQDNIILKAPPAIKCPHNLNKTLEELAQNPSYQKILELEYQQANQKLDILEQDRYLPMFKAKMFSGQNEETRDYQYGVGIEVEIPLWNKQNGEYKALKAQKSNASVKLASLKQVDFEKIVKSVYNNLHEQAESIKIYQSSILPKYKKSVAEIEESFLNGQSSILDVWQIREKYFAAQSGYLNVLKSALNAKIELETLIGKNLENIK